MLKNFLALMISLLVSVLILEIFLHIYNPFAPRIKGDKIQLPVNKVYHIENDKLSRLDKKITHSRNSLGFRGPDPTDQLQNQTSIICVGGSTTECYYLGDGLDWPAFLSADLQKQIPDIWINNAGLDGHSTWGHLLLLKQHVLPLHPDFIIMLSGINDVGRSDISNYDTKQINQEAAEKKTSLKELLFEYSEILNTIRTIRMGLKAMKQGVGHTDLMLSEQEHFVNSSGEIDSALQAHQIMIKLYGERIQQIIQECKNAGTQLVLVTQPMLWGDTIDPVSGIYLGDIRMDEKSNSLMRWKILQAYNQELKRIAFQNEISVVDLAEMLPKSSEYFYDEIHFTPEGSKKTAQLISQNFMALKYPDTLNTLSK